jgi:hypothetical protein
MSPPLCGFVAPCEDQEDSVGQAPPCEPFYAWSCLHCGPWRPPPWRGLALGRLKIAPQASVAHRPEPIHCLWLCPESRFRETQRLCCHESIARNYFRHPTPWSAASEALRPMLLPIPVDSPAGSVHAKATGTFCSAARRVFFRSRGCTCRQLLL